MKQDQKKKKKKKPIRNKTGRWATARGVGVTILLVLLFRAFVAEAYVIPSGSMEPTLQVGDRLVVDKAVYGLRIPWTTERLTGGRAPRRGEVVIFLDPKGTGETLIKRVVATAGDTVALRGNRLVVNGKPVPRRFLGASSTTLTFEERHGEATYHVLQRADLPATNFGPVRVPEGHAFVLGDNRDDSSDSRYWGPLPCANLKGRARAILWSYGEDGPRWERFFSPIN